MPSGIYIRTEYHKAILRENGFKKGEKKLPFSEEHKEKLAKTGFQKGQKSWNSGKEMDYRHEKHPLWKGDKVSYVGLHQWVSRYLGKPDTCENCGKSGLKGRQIHWSNISGKYKRDLSDWQRFCVSCHSHYDLKRNSLIMQ